LLARVVGTSLPPRSDEHIEAVKQAAVADWLLISKTDLADVNEFDPALLFDSGPFDSAGKSALDWDRFNRWLMAVRASRSDRLLRVKGVLDVVGESQPLVIHGVHRTFHPPTLLARWPDSDRRSRLVFITRDLDRATVAASWNEMA
jgi:G3E family GTPase